MEITVQDHGDGADEQRFFRDVCRMVETVAHRMDSTVVEFVANSPGERTFAVDARTADLLSALAGVHRAQLVPESSTTGRVITVKVSLGVGEPAPRGQVIRTYNYPMGRATDHRDGTRLTLQDALDGHVQPTSSHDR